MICSRLLEHYKSSYAAVRCRGYITFLKYGKCSEKAIADVFTHRVEILRYRRRIM